MDANTRSNKVGVALRTGNGYNDNFKTILKSFTLFCASVTDLLQTIATSWLITKMSY